MIRDLNDFDKKKGKEENFDFLANVFDYDYMEKYAYRCSLVWNVTEATLERFRGDKNTVSVTNFSLELSSSK